MSVADKKTTGNLPGPGPGRPKGSLNKTTALLKDAILKAAEKAGEKLGGTEDGNGLVAYLTDQAEKNPGPFMSLLGKVLPMQVTGDDGGPIKTEVAADGAFRNLVSAMERIAGSATANSVAPGRVAGSGEADAAPAP